MFLPKRDIWLPTAKRLWHETDGGVLQGLQDGCATCGCEPETTTCTHCIDSEAPAEVRVTIAGMITTGAGDTCDNCTSLNASYILPILDGCTCIWYLDDIGYSCSDTRCAGATGPFSMMATVVRRVSPSPDRLFVRIQLGCASEDWSDLFAPPTGTCNGFIIPACSLSWTKTVQNPYTGEFDCMSLNEAFTTAHAFGQACDGFGAICNNSSPSSATALLEAV